MNELIKSTRKNGIYISQDNIVQPHLHDNILLLLKKFKSAYESKDFEALRHTISDNFNGNFENATSKIAIVNLFENYLSSLPRVLGLSLEIKIYHIVESSKSLFSGIVEFKTKLKIGPFKTKKMIESGKLYCEARPDGIINSWRISKINLLSNTQDGEDNNVECYKAIGVDPKSSVEDITRAYKKRIALLHPDTVADRAPEIQEFAKKETQKMIKNYNQIIDQKKLSIKKIDDLIVSTANGKIKTMLANRDDFDTLKEEIFMIRQRLE